MEKDYYQTNTNQSSVSTTASNLHKASSTTTAKNKLDALFELCGLDSSPVAPIINNTFTIDEEIGYYISVINVASSRQNDLEIDFSEFWSQHQHRLPLMSTTVKRVNIIPASSVPCESMFSIAGYIRRKERSSLSATAMRYSMVLKDRHNLSLFVQ
ncbi:unnamed protein product [Adineta steineri]|uniref:HAT C-terminal dimerisation domain-containing protein n=1 Tax=Adineta steineri TaxID=433720 RepID=A0A815FI97_9BILA|nr:unnamed protein product [Adineta steineri]CAF4251601.1 unnamed protein product [Adineta steineri]